MAHFNNALIGATSGVVALPEILERIGQYLDQPDIASCLHVCHTWNKILMPVQWRRVDDLAWSEIFKQDTADVAEEWIRTKFANHGRHIRHLSIQFNIVEIIVQTEECRHLVSLTAHSLPFKNFNSLPSALARSSLKLQQQRLPFIQSLSPIFERAYLASQASSRITRAQFLEFYPRFTSIPMSFWLLIQQNPGLVSLTLPSVRVTDSSFSEEIIYSALSILKNLKELNVGWIKVDVLKTLQRTPQLELLRMDRWNQLFSLTQDFVSLRVLILGISVEFKLLFKALDRLPGVVHLQVHGLMGDGSESSTAAFVASRKTAKEAGSGQSLSVRTFEILHIWERESLVVLLVQLFPSLVDFRSTETLSNKVMDALWEHCYLLDAVNGKEGAARWRERRKKDGIAM